MTQSSPHPLTTALHIAGVAALAWIAVGLTNLPRSEDAPPTGLPAEKAVAIDDLLARIESLERELANARLEPARAMCSAVVSGCGELWVTTASSGVSPRV